MKLKKEKEMTLEEMQEECVKCAFEIARLESIKNRHQKYFDELNYKIYNLKNSQDASKLPADTENNS